MPAVATAEALKLLLPSSRALFLTTDRKSEKHCRGALGAFEVAEVPGTPCHGIRHNILLPVRVLRSAGRVLNVLRAFRPHVVVGLGGHNCVVPVLVARALGIKTMLRESNARPGRAVRLLAPMADCVVVQWQQAARHMRAKRTLAAGCPVRSRLFDAERDAAARRLGLVPGKCTLLALGGSQGASALNEALYGALKLLYEEGLELQVIHLTGVDHLPTALAQQANAFTSYRAIGFLDRMEDAYAAADFVLARAGASTLAELTALGLPSILVPYPYATGDHQRVNAAVLARAGAAWAVAQSELTERRLADMIEALALNPRRRAEMAGRARTQGRPQAALTVAAELASTAGFGRPVHLSPQNQAQITKQSSRAA